MKHRRFFLPSRTVRLVGRVFIILVMVVVYGALMLSPTNAAVIYKNGVLTSNETWTPNNIYVIDGDLTVDNGVTLTIEAGTVVKFQFYYANLIVNGVLDAQGTTSNRVVFTSYLDDSYGGDTNGDGTVSAPAAGNWGSIFINNSANVLDYTLIQYGGAFANMALFVNASATIANNIIRNNLCGIYVGSGSPTISNNAFSNNSVRHLCQATSKPHLLREYLLRRRWGRHSALWACCNRRCDMDQCARLELALSNLRKSIY